MISIYLTLNAKAFCKTAAVLALAVTAVFSESIAQQPAVMPPTAPVPAVSASASPASTVRNGEPAVNYSRWPRRSELWVKASELVKANKTAEARKLLEAEAAQKELPAECKKILSDLKFKQIFDPNGADKTTYKVVRGDSLFTIARKTKSSADYIMAINGIINPSRLNIGDHFQVRPLNLKIIIDVKKKSLSLVDNGEVIRTYPVLAQRTTGTGTLKTVLKSEAGLTGSGAVSAMSELYAAANKRLILKTGMVIEGTKNASAPTAGFFLNPQDCNEISLLVIPGNEVEIIH